jgi:hypothetical protein
MQAICSEILSQKQHGYFVERRNLNIFLHASSTPFARFHCIPPTISILSTFIQPLKGALSFRFCE